MTALSCRLVLQGFEAGLCRIAKGAALLGLVVELRSWGCMGGGSIGLYDLRWVLVGSCGFSVVP